MGKIKLVEEIDGLVEINTIFVSVTNKDGLVSNKNSGNGPDWDLPPDGLIGQLVRINPKVLIISTGGTAELIEEAGYQVMEISKYTGWPEMETGLVKSMNPKLYVGMLAHPYTPSDAEYMTEFNIPPVDMVLVNFYPFQKAVEENPISPENLQAFEIIRQQMDVGGPTAVHTSGKGFLTTAVASNIDEYSQFAADLQKFNGYISVDTRITAMKNATEALYQYHKAIRDFMKSTDNETIKKSYKIIHNSSERRS